MNEKSLEYFKNRLSKTLSDKRREAYQDAVRALERQISRETLEKQLPKKPIENDGFLSYYKCPKCKRIVPLCSEYCSDCGQRLDWSE